MFLGGLAPCPRYRGDPGWIRGSSSLRGFRSSGRASASRGRSSSSRRCSPYCSRCRRRARSALAPVLPATLRRGRSSTLLGGREAPARGLGALGSRHRRPAALLAWQDLRPRRPLRAAPSALAGGPLGARIATGMAGSSTRCDPRDKATVSQAQEMGRIHRRPGVRGESRTRQQPGSNRYALPVAMGESGSAGGGDRRREPPTRPT